MDVELRHLRYFLAVSEERHFGRAATRLGIRQPGLSQQLRKLEDALGVTLLVRTSRRVALTEAGRAFAVEARRALLHAERAVEAATRAGRGEIGHVAAGFRGSSAVWLAPAIASAFRRRCSAATLEVHELDLVTGVGPLVDGRLDVVFLHPRSDEGIRLETLMREPLCAVVPAGHRVAGDASVALTGLRDEVWVCVPASGADGLRAWFLELCRRAGFAPRIDLEATTQATILALVAEGHCLSVMPASGQALGRGGVAFVPIEGETMTLAMGWRPEPESPTTAAFLATARLAAAELAEQGAVAQRG